MEIVSLGIVLEETSKVHVLLGLKLVKTPSLHFADFVQAGQTQLEADARCPLTPAHRETDW